MTLSHAEYFLKESINSHGSQLLKYAKDNYPKYGRGTLFFHFTPIGYEFECGDVIYLNINDIIQSSERIFGNNIDNIMIRDIIENYDPNNEFICTIIVSFLNNTNDLKFAKCNINNI